MQPLIDKYAINPETNKLFLDILEMFDEQPNYQIWAVKLIFSKAATMEQLAQINEWVARNQTNVKMLDKQNVVSYSSKTAIEQLFKEMRGIDDFIVVKSTIGNFNTEQKKMLSERFLNEDRKLNGTALYRDSEISNWAEIFRKFNRLPANRKSKFYSNCSRLKNLKDLMDAINACLNESYKWDKDDFMAFLANNASDCEVVFNEGNFVIIHVPSFKSSELLCGHGRTSWCITQKDSYWHQYVQDYPNRDQYFLFDFSRKESDAFAHIGFTMENGKGFYCAQTCNNNDMKSPYRQGNETMTIVQALEKANVPMSIFMRLNPLKAYKWDAESIIEFLNGAKYCVAYNKDGKLIVMVNDNEALRKLVEHTLYNVGQYRLTNNSKAYVFIDTTVPCNDQKSLLIMLYEKDEYGTMSLKRVFDPYNSDVTKDGYLAKIGISSTMFLDREKIDSRILLHKFIDEGDEAAAIELINSEGKDFDVNYDFKKRTPVIMAIDKMMLRLFNTIISHPKYECELYDGFGESLLESLMYLYASDEVVSTPEEDENLIKMINSLLRNKNYNYNLKDLNHDTCVLTACEYKKLEFAAKVLFSKKEADVNIVNTFDITPLTQCIIEKNLTLIEILGQRPDLKVRDRDREEAKSAGIDLDKYIKPNNDIFGKYVVEDEDTTTTAAKATSKAEMAEAMSV